MANVQSIDLGNRFLDSDQGRFDFDYLILACGSSPSYFGNQKWELFAPSLKTLEQATEIRRRLLISFERAESTNDPTKRASYLTFVVVGGGPTGVELAGAIGEISKFTLVRDFRNIDPSKTRIILVEAGNRVLPSFDPSLSKKASEALTELGVEVRTNACVTEIDASGVRIDDEMIPAKTILWAAGVGPSEINSSLKVELDQAGRLIVREDLSLPDHPHIFCVGDQAAFLDSRFGSLPGVAPVAIQQGVHAARNILADLEGSPRRPFIYMDKGQLATIGRRKAVMELARLKSYGFIAWVIWLFVHIFYLIGFKNRMFVFFQWAFQYIFYSKGARLILNKNWRTSTSRRDTEKDQLP